MRISMSETSRGSSVVFLNAAVARDDREVPYLGREVQDLLTRASAHLQEDGLPAPLFALVVRYHIWPSAQAIAYLRKYPPHLQIHYLRSLAPYLKDDDWKDVLDLLRTVREGYWIATFLHDLATYFPDAAIEEGLVLARRVRDEKYRARAYQSLLPAWALHGHPREALEEANTLNADRYRAYVLFCLLPALPAVWLDEMLALSRTFRESHHRALILEGLAPHLSFGFEARMLAVLDDLRAPYTQVGVLCVWLPYVPDTWRIPLAARALGLINAVEEEHLRALLFARLAPHLPLELLPQALDIANRIEEPLHRFDGLLPLLAICPHHQRKSIWMQALQAAEEVVWPYHRVRAWIRLLPHLPERERRRLRRQALSDAEARLTGYERVAVLAALFPHLAPRQQRRVFALLVDTLQALRTQKAQAWTALVPALAQTGFYQEVLTLLQREREEDPLGWAVYIARAADRLPPPWLGEALIQASQLSEGEARARALAALVPWLASMPRSQVYFLWRAIAAHLGRYPQKELLQDLAALLPLFERLGGEKALADIARVIGQLLNAEPLREASD